LNTCLKVEREKFAVALLCVILLLVACTKDGDTIYLPDPNEEAASTVPLVTVIYGPDDLGDRRYCDMIYEGVETAAATYGLRTMLMSPQSYDEGIQYLELMFRQMAAASDTVRRLFIVPQPAYDSYIRANSHRLEANPYADLLYLETQTPLEGKGSTLYLPYYGAMLEAGALTPLSKTKVVLIGANPHTETVAEAMQGFADGFATDHIVPDPSLDEKELQTVYLSEQVGGGFTIADTTVMRLMDGWRADEMELLVPVCGGACNTFNRLNNALMWPFSMVGIDTDDDSYYFKPFSAVKHIDRAVALCIGQWLSSEGMPKHQTLGLASGYTEVVKHWEWTDQEATDEDVLNAIHEEAIRKESLTPDPSPRGEGSSY